MRAPFRFQIHLAQGRHHNWEERSNLLSNLGPAYQPVATGPPTRAKTDQWPLRAWACCCVLLVVIGAGVPTAWALTRRGEGRSPQEQRSALAERRSRVRSSLRRPPPPPRGRSPPPPGPPAPPLPPDLGDSACAAAVARISAVHATTTSCCVIARAPCAATSSRPVSRHSLCSESGVMRSGSSTFPWTV